MNIGRIKCRAVDYWRRTEASKMTPSSISVLGQFTHWTQGKDMLLISLIMHNTKYITELDSTGKDA